MAEQNATATAKPAPLPLINEAQEAGARDAFKVLYTHFASHGTTQLPSFDECDLNGWELVAQRALKGVKVLRQARREEALREVRQGIKDAIAPHIEAQRQEKTQYDLAAAAMPDSMRKFLAPFPTSVNVPMSEIVPAFPQGTKPETMIVALKDLSYTVGKGVDGKSFVKVPTPFTSK